MEIYCDNSQITKNNAGKLEELVIKIQNGFRKKKTNIKYLNNELYFTYYCLLGIMKRLRDSFRYDILAQYHYYHNMEKLEDMLKKFSVIPRPINIKYLYDNGAPNIKDIHTDLMRIVESCGALTIFDIIRLNYNIDPIVMNNNYRLMTFYNKVFNPISCQIYDLNHLEKFNYPNLNETNAIEVYRSKNKYDTCLYDMKLIGNIKEPSCYKINKQTRTLVEHVRGGRLYIPLNYPKTGINSIIVMNGYFIEDSLNISRLGGIMEQKNRHLQSLLTNLEINKSFKSGYIEQLSLRDFVIYNNQEISTRCLEAFNESNKLVKKTFAKLAKDFIEANPEKKRYMITLLLLMKDNKQTQYLAYSLYDMISSESCISKTQIIGEKIFNSLHWSIQKRFKVVMNDIGRYSQELGNFSEEDITFKKRILLMKAPEHIKRKAMDKFKEVNSKGANDNSSKPQQYLEGILKIPFGIYRKEYIINFLSDFQTEIQHFIFLIADSINRRDGSNKYVSNINHQLAQYQTLKAPYKSYDIQKILNEMFYVYSKWNNLSIRFDEMSMDDLQNWMTPILYDMTIIELKQLIRDTIKKYDIGISISGNKKKIINNYIHSGLDYKHLATNIQTHSLISKISMNADDLINYKKIGQLQNSWDQYRTQSRQYLKDVNHILDEAIYGQEDAKTKIKRIIGQWINGDSDGYCLGFEGYPGTGKTSLAKKGIAHCLKDNDGSPRPFSFIALGGSTHGATLEGHSYTYVGSTWGEIANVLMETQCMNPIIFIDELDKVSQTEHGKEIVGILTHLTDASQNSEFCDKYFGIKLDLSKCLFIFSYNDASKIDPILADRIHKVKFKPLSLTDKITVTRNYLFPETLEKVGFNKNQINISDETIKYLIRNYTYEAGVRKLKEVLTEIFRELNLIHLQDEQFNLINIDIDTIESILPSNHRIIHKKINNKSLIGSVNGMFATTLGLGGLTIIQACFTPSENKLNLQLTGQQGDVMQESMKVAKTLALRLVPSSILKQLLNDMDKSGNMGIHIHCPEGATQKDGPSAGTAITVALVSILTNIPVLNTVAITGEIDMMGNVMAIGGLDIKIAGAKLAGVKTILCPYQNKDSLAEIKKRKNTVIDNSIEIIMVHNIWQVLDIVFPDHKINFQNNLASQK